MAKNWYEYFYYNYDNDVDQFEQTAQTLTDILIAPGMFMLELGITDEDLESEYLAKQKIKAWLQQFKD